MRQLARMIGPLCLAALLAVAAGAEEAPAPPRPRPCADDIARFCKDIAPGKGRVRVCLDAHTTDLSAACRASLDAKIQIPGHVMGCKDELRRYCKGVRFGGGRLLGCLEAHRSDLTATCKASLPPPRVPPPPRRRQPTFTPSPDYPST